MREHLLRLLLDRPFSPFVIRLEGGYEVRVIHHEFATLEPAVLIMTVQDMDGRLETFETDRIVSLKTIDPV